MQCLKIVLAVAIAATLTVSIPKAATRVTEDFADLVKLAEAVVEVEILEKEVAPESPAGIPATIVKAKVTKVHKGHCAADTVISIQYFGGAKGEQVVVVPGQPELTPGRRALLLLTKVGDHWRIIGGDVGHVQLYRDETGASMAKRECGRFEFYVKDERSFSGYTAVDSVAISARQLGEVVQATLKTGRPVIETPAAVAQSTPAPAATPSLHHAGTSVAALPTPESNLAFRVFVILSLTTLTLVIMRRMR